MAILIEEEKKKTNWGLMLGFLVVLILISTTVYYLFFVNPAEVQVFISPKLQALSSFKQLNFNPDQLLNNPLFTSLQSTIQLSAPSSTDFVGKSNPFVQ